VAIPEKVHLGSERYRWRKGHRKPVSRPWLALGISRSTDAKPRPASKPPWPRNDGTGSVVCARHRCAHFESGADRELFARTVKKIMAWF
jgi:hypothetical protein